MPEKVMFSQVNDGMMIQTLVYLRYESVFELARWSSIQPQEDETEKNADGPLVEIWD
jgi:hypothetical protein